MLRPLIKRRLVISEASADDARVAFAVLADNGRRLVAEALPSARRLAAQLLETDLSKQDLSRVAELIAGLAREPGK
jgi:DNA-binding MarR family transcriptional regulator